MTERENEPANVESLSSYRPSSKMYQVSITFSGEAAISMNELMIQLKAANPNDIVKRAIALLLAAQGKRILLLDPETGTAEAVEI